MHRIEITSTTLDTRASSLERRLVGQGYHVRVVGLADVYTVDKKFSKHDIELVASMLTNPVTHRSDTVKPVHPAKFDWAVEIGYLPGVTDNVATTAKEMITDRLHTVFVDTEGVYTSQVIFLQGKISQILLTRLTESLYNPLIQRVSIKSAINFKKDAGMDHIVPKVMLENVRVVDLVDLHVDDQELEKIGKAGIANVDGTRRGPLALSLTSMKVIAAYFQKKKRNPTDIELESIAQTWSEHCKHIIFNSPLDEIKEGLFKRYIKRATDTIRAKKGKKDICVSVFTDNSGAIKFDETYLITHKVETHNSPSALDPFGGAVTGICGVNRDAIGFGMGAKPIINMYGFCLGDPMDARPLYKDAALTQKMLSPRRIFDGVVAGVNAGGNCSGIPTPEGFLCFDDRYRGKPLVIVGTVGLSPLKIHGKKSYIKKSLPGDYIVMVGGRVGVDGIHGATFSSEALSSGSPATAVQIGDPITQKKLSDMIVKEARDADLYHSITDNGAGGLSCSVAEMAKEAGGCIVHLENVPLKYPGLAPWQIWISESQERMTLAVAKNKWKKFAALVNKRGVEATIIGQFTKSGKCIVEYKKKRVVELDMRFLHDGYPYEHLKSAHMLVSHAEPKLPKLTDYTSVLMRMMARPNIASYSFLSTQYDHEVQASSVLKPLQGKGRVNADSSVTRPVLSSPKGVVLSQGFYPTYGDIDMYAMASSSIDAAVRGAVVAGANPQSLALLDNFCWCSARDSARLYELKQAVRACYDTAVAYQTPFISGKDSMFNDFAGFDTSGKPVKISIPPTLLVSSIGVMEDCTKAVSLDAKMAGDLIYVLGETFEELGASEYFSFLGSVGNKVPQVFPGNYKKLYQAYFDCLQKGLIASGQSVGRGGLAVALVKTAMGGMLGMDVSLQKLPGKVRYQDSALFAESQGRIVVTIAATNQIVFERMLAKIPYRLLGKVTNDGMVRMSGIGGKPIISTSVKRVLEAYRSTFLNY